ncbi:MAG: class I SAM-dependent methyltransferase [Oscillospiraceae bacterium]|nr:class I SAM-dependent methyltransferase [Oscillospiraceae bacterium]
MHIPLSNRLSACAQMIAPGAMVADVGTDHGYLAIYLLRNHIAAQVCAADLREKPLEKARMNAAAAGVGEQIQFYRCDGLQLIPREMVDTIVCAGMGGDTIAHILDDCSWVQDPALTLILQPQTSGNDLRRYLGAHGFSIEEERLVLDGGRIYFAMRVRFDGGSPLTPGQQYVSPQLLASGSALLPDYLDRVIAGLRRAVEGISQSQNPEERARLFYYETALHEVLEMKL